MYGQKRCSRPDLVIRNKSLKQREAVSRAHKGKRLPQSTREKIRLGVLKAYREGRLKVRSGKDHPMYGKHNSQKQKETARRLFKRLNKNKDFQRKRLERLREWNSSKAKGEIFKRLNKDSSFIKRRMQALCKTPTKPEQKFMEIIVEYDLPYTYVGDGSFLIAGLNPDFVHSNGEKRVVEIFGRVWHELLLKKGDWKRTEKGRKTFLKQYGYEALIIWEEELNDEETVAKRVSEWD